MILIQHLWIKLWITAKIVDNLNENHSHLEKPLNENDSHSRLRAPARQSSSVMMIFLFTCAAAPPRQ
tara:strand:- start:225 stop:425 length:201 start_codon:yes stop_codon:yes gene_type:complete